MERLIPYAPLVGVGLLIALGGVFALSWALSSGQFGDARRGSRSIFDPDEPVGQPTDAFPDPDNND